jgi:hypothetical protein
MNPDIISKWLNLFKHHHKDRSSFINFYLSAVKKEQDLRHSESCSFIQAVFALLVVIGYQGYRSFPLSGQEPLRLSLPSLLLFPAAVKFLPLQSTRFRAFFLIATFHIER